MPSMRWSRASFRTTPRSRRLYMEPVEGDDDSIDAAVTSMTDVD
jgi:hypothetical protein